MLRGVTRDDSASLWALTVRGRLTALVLLGAGAVTWGCSQPSETQGSGDGAIRLLEARRDSGVVLRALLLRDTIPPGNDASVEVVYAVVNGPRPMRFDNDPGRYRIVVNGPDGQPAKSLGGAGPAAGIRGQFRMMLPAGGSLVQRQDLRCINDAAYSPVHFSPGMDTCLAMYDLGAPGRYQVIVEYFGPDVGTLLDSVASQTEPRRPAGDGVHLADTATFIVAGK